MSEFGSSDTGTVAEKTHFFLFLTWEKGSIVDQLFFNFATPTNSTIVGDTVYPFT